MSHRIAFVSGCILSAILVWPVAAQTPGDTRPDVGLRENPPDTFFLENARVVVRPGVTLESASISIRGTSIVDVGTNITPQPGALVVDCAGKTVYAGLIDAYGEIDVPDPPSNGNGHWNGNVLPRRAASTAIKSLSDVSVSRSQGITMRIVAPKGAIVKGTSCLALLSDGGVTLIDDDVAQHLQLTVPRGNRRDRYPNSPMGAIALLRQTMLDADWYTRAWKTYRARPELRRPARNDDLARLAEDRSAGRFVIDAPNERMALRADSIANEFSLNAAIQGSGREYRELESLAKTGRLFLVPVDFPDAPDVATGASADDASLRDLMHWHFAPENASRLVAAGVRICLTSHGLDDQKSFLKNVRVAVERGLPSDAALAALTTVPANWLGISDVAGEIKTGALANLVVTDGELFAKKTKVNETWIAGKRFQFDSTVSPGPDALIGDWKLNVKIAGDAIPVALSLKRGDKKWTGEVTLDRPTKESKPADDNTEEEQTKSKTLSIKLNDVTRANDRLTAWLDLSQLDPRFPKGPSMLTMVTVGDSDSTVTFVTLEMSSGSTQYLGLLPADSAPEKNGHAKKEGSEDGDDQADDETDQQEPLADKLDEIPVNHPLGAYGSVSPIPSVTSVLFRNATVWTCDEAGVMENADVLVINGKISAVGESLRSPPGCKMIDAKGKHITPGMIDCHSHMGTDGGVNESGQAVTAEVRIGDFIDHSDINIYRQLAGGLTTANILHGSANPIGGQNQVVKLRWGDAMESMKLDGAPGGIKFALGENVKRSNRSETPTRYPSSRMGVEQLFRDRFLAAQSYEQEFQRWRQGKRDGLPPRRDLELEALAEILRGERWIHCHSYRQDEIVALLDLLDTFGVTIGTLQHILEGYKVADRMLEHGAMASAFSDWWAYKFEVYDAIPDNGAIMHDVGIVVSFNSDDRELARHLNTEAAKAVKYGNVPPEEALKFVTLNPAKQLRIDHRVGSITVGKDADLVLWSGPPLSTLSRCEQTWVDGREMFSIDTDRKLRQRDAKWRSLLIRKALDSDAKTVSGDKPTKEEDRWLRYDEFCHGHDHQDDEHAGHNHAGKILAGGQQ